jgi:hypothetical protein
MENLIELITSDPIVGALKSFFFFGAVQVKSTEIIEKAIEENMNKFKNVRNPNIVRNILRWLEDDNFSELVLKDIHGFEYTVELDILKKEYINFLEIHLKSIYNVTNNFEQVADLLVRNEEYQLQVARLRMVIDPEIQLSKNIHKKTGIQYLKVKGFWLNDIGFKERKYFKSLGRLDKYPDGIEDASAILEGRRKIREDIFAEYSKLYPKK